LHRSASSSAHVGHWFLEMAERAHSVHFPWDVEFHEFGRAKTSSAHSRWTSVDSSTSGNSCARRVKSWSIGDRVPVTIPLWDKNVAFHGLERPVRQDAPTFQQLTKLKSYAKSVKEYSTHDLYIVAFVNSRSGGQAGASIMKALEESLGRIEEDGKALLGEVCDVSLPEEPNRTISLLATAIKEDDGVERRLLVCGGDGTVTWILTALEQCEGLEGFLERVPVGIVPLGTGNDLARSLGWGGRLRCVSGIVEYLKWIVAATPVALDQWRLVLRPHASIPSGHKLRTMGSHPQLVKNRELAAQLIDDVEYALEDSDSRVLVDQNVDEVYLGYWQNYFSIGADAVVARGVDIARNNTACGQACFQNGFGKFCYVWQFLRNAFGLECLTPSLYNLKVSEPASSVSEMQVLEPPLHKRKVCGSRGRVGNLMLSNINSYSSGRPCSPSPSQASTKPSPSDGYVEVLALRNMVCLAAMMAGIRPTYLFSTRTIAFTVASGQTMQQDGEPWRLDVGCDIMIEPHRKVTMLRAPEDAPFWGGHIQKGFWFEQGNG